MSRPTLLDVAQGAGVSRATAARVLAGSPRVNAEMAALVQREARRLGYETNAAARSLRSGRSGSIALVIAIDELDSPAGSFLASVLKGATKALARTGQQLVLLPVEDGRADRVAQYVRAGHVDGAIVVLQHEIRDMVPRINQAGRPLVYVGRPAEDLPPDASVVDADNVGGGRLAAEAVLARGRTRPAIIRGPADMQAAVDRLEGWRTTLAAHGLRSLVTTGDFTLAGGAVAMARLLERDREVDAVFASSDLMALGAVRVLSAAGRSVPADVSVVGFDDLALAATAEPPLTTVRQPLEEMGRAAAELVLDLVAGTARSTVLTLPTSLTSRESV